MDADQFASRWADAWNRRDVEEVLAHFDDDIVFTSPTARAVTGEAVVRGKESLRAYWNAAMARIQSIRFDVERVLWDAGRRELAIIYTARIDGAAKRVSENLILDESGRVIEAEVFHGA